MPMRLTGQAPSSEAARAISPRPTAAPEADEGPDAWRALPLPRHQRHDSEQSQSAIDDSSFLANDPSLVDLASAQSVGVTASVPAGPLSFSAFVGSLDGDITSDRAHLPSASVVSIPAGHPLSYNRPMSPSSATRAGVDLFMRTCSLCDTRLYAVADAGHAVYPCAWCSGVAVYCSVGCMVEDWLSGRHPPACAEAQRATRVRLDADKARRTRRVHQHGGWMEVTSAPRMNPPVRASSAARSRSPLRHLHPEEDTWAEGGDLHENPYGASSFLPSDVLASLHLGAVRAAESDAARSSPESLSAAIDSLSVFPRPAPAVRLATRGAHESHDSTAGTRSSATPRNRSTVADMVVRRELETGIVVPPMSRSTDSYALDSHRAHALLVAELRAHETAAQTDVAFGVARPTVGRRPASAKLAPTPTPPASVPAPPTSGVRHKRHAPPQAASRLLTRAHAHAKHVTPATQAAAGLSSHGANVTHAVPYAPPGTGRRPAGGIASGTASEQRTNPSELHYHPLASTTQLYAKTRNAARPQTAGATRTKSMSATRPGSARRATGSVTGAFSHGFVAPRHFGIGGGHTHAHGTLDLFTRLAHTPTAGFGTVADHPSLSLHFPRGPVGPSRPPRSVIPIVDLRRAVAATADLDDDAAVRTDAT